MPETGNKNLWLDERLTDRRYDLVVVTPCYNDLESLAQLLDDLDKEAANSDDDWLVLVVDDGSDVAVVPDVETTKIDVAYLHLASNVGHQRAIALGVATVATELETPEQVIVMDCDGEDRVEDIAKLRQAAGQSPDAIVLANRARRSEPLAFRIFYTLYRLLYRVLTGHWIRHGNFCLLPGSRIRRLTNQASMWNHFAASLFASRIPCVSISVDRGRRYAGDSTMSYSSLVVHGLSAISVHMEVVGARLILMAVLLTLAALAASGTIVWIRLFTTWAIPGWASILSAIFFILAVLGMLLALQLTFLILALRDHAPVIPAQDASRFIQSSIFRPASD